MKKTAVYALLVPLLGLFLTISVSAGSSGGYKTYTDIGPIEKSDLTVSKVVSDPDKYDREIITVDGKVSDLKYKKFINGRKFTLFKLRDDNNKTIKVYGRGFIDAIEDGSQVRIYGRYSKKKRFLFKKYKNVMKAKKMFVLESQVF